MQNSPANRAQIKRLSRIITGNRPIKQLQVLGKSIGIPVYDEGQGNPVEIIKHGYQYAKDNGFDLVIYDTAGRLQIDEELMQELEKARDAVHPDEILFVADAMIGQEAVLSSMTPKERKKPQIIDGSRKARIAKGSGTEIGRVNAVLKQYDGMKEMFKKVGAFAQKQNNGGQIGSNYTPPKVKKKRK